MHTVKTASDAWKLLKGLICVYKPSDYPLGSFVYTLRRNLVQDLNEMRRSVECNSISPSGGELIGSDGNLEDNHLLDIKKYESDYKELVPPDYSIHPLVLGKGEYGFGAIYRLSYIMKEGIS